MVSRITAEQIMLTKWTAGNSIITHRPTMVEAVLILPDQAAAMTRLCSTAMSRRPDTANSRKSTTATTQPGICPFSMKKHMAASTSILSARGSINLPKLEIWL